MEQPSILTQVVLEPLLKTACRNLAGDGFLIPVLLVEVEPATPVIVPLDLPPTPEQKQRYFTQLGTQFGHHGQMIRAAVMLSESWFVNAQKAPAAFTFLPSQHPSRQEAIVLIGRNTDNSRATHVIQPFVRSRNNQPEWGTRPIAVFNEPVETASKSKGLLDYLFLANRR